MRFLIIISLDYYCLRSLSLRPNSVARIPPPDVASPASARRTEPAWRVGKRARARTRCVGRPRRDTIKCILPNVIGRKRDSVGQLIRMLLKRTHAAPTSQRIPGRCTMYANGRGRSGIEERNANATRSVVFSVTAADAKNSNEDRTH